MGQDVQSDELAALVKQLPMKLRVGVNIDVLEIAIAENVIGISGDGRLEWKLQSKTLLAHFCGRMWCGDTIKYNKKKRTWRWVLGDKDFPEKDIDALFGVTGVRDLRKRRDYCCPPSGFELIDNLFSI